MLEDGDVKAPRLKKRKPAAASEDDNSPAPTRVSRRLRGETAPGQEPTLQDHWISSKAL